MRLPTVGPLVSGYISQSVNGHMLCGMSMRIGRAQMLALYVYLWDDFWGIRRDFERPREPYGVQASEDRQTGTRTKLETGEEEQANDRRKNQGELALEGTYRQIVRNQ